MIILGTGNYKNIKRGNTVSITGDGGNAWGYYGPAYKKLAPKLITYTPYSEQYQQLITLKQELKDYKKMRDRIELEYIASYYETRLKDLDIEELLMTLKTKFGENIILLCHEPIEEFCHRRVLADYIELQTGLYIPEISYDETGNIQKHNPIRYKQKLKKMMNK